MLTAAIALAVFLMVIDILSPLQSGWLLATQVVELSEEYHESIATNRALTEHNEFLKTEAGLEWATRRHQGLVHPNERVLSITEKMPQDSVPISRQERCRTWIENVETHAARWVIKRCAVLKYYLKLRGFDQPVATVTATAQGTGTVQEADATVASDEPLIDNEAENADVVQECAG